MGGKLRLTFLPLSQVEGKIRLTVLPLSQVEIKLRFTFLPLCQVEAKLRLTVLAERQGGWKAEVDSPTRETGWMES